MGRSERRSNVNKTSIDWAYSHPFKCTGISGSTESLQKNYVICWSAATLRSWRDKSPMGQAEVTSFWVPAAPGWPWDRRWCRAMGKGRSCWLFLLDGDTSVVEVTAAAAHGVFTPSEAFPFFHIRLPRQLCIHPWSKKAPCLCPCTWFSHHIFALKFWRYW